MAIVKIDVVEFDVGIRFFRKGLMGLEAFHEKNSQRRYGHMHMSNRFGTMLYHLGY